ncbi:hypothetical protein AX15_000257 [Amanita polypyramis BW_CC]|nr:hypothetical protein AX15_000257 [Amanita polypyramis BW_CC]
MPTPTPEPTSQPSSSVLQSQALNSTAKKRPHKEDRELDPIRKKHKREAKPESSVVAAPAVSQSLTPSNTISLEPVPAGSPRRDKDKKKKKRKKRRMSIADPELGDDRTKSKRSTLLVLTAPESALPSATKVDNKEPTDAETTVAGHDGVDKRKGKEKRFSPVPSVPPQSSAATRGRSPLVDNAAQAQMESLKQQLESQSQLLKKYQTHLTSVQQSLTCQICLDLLYRPFALAPCGHVSCYDCLVRWFTAPGAGEDAANNQNADEDRPAGGVVTGDHIHKRKTCPICRARVFERPVEVWGMKDMVNGLARSNLIGVVPSANADEASSPNNGRNAQSSENTASDPWHKIFRFTRHVYGNHQFIPFWPDQTFERVNGPLEDVGMYDVEDHVHRCLDCMHEIWGGRCSHCDRVYSGHPEVGDEEDDEEDIMNLDEDLSNDEDGYGISLGELLERMDEGGEHIWHYEEVDSEEEEEFFTDEEVSWEEDPVYDGITLGPMIWHEASEPLEGIAYVEEVNDENEDEYDSSFIDDGDEDEYRSVGSGGGGEETDEMRRLEQAGARMAGQRQTRRVSQRPRVLGAVAESGRRRRRRG